MPRRLAPTVGTVKNHVATTVASTQVLGRKNNEVLVEAGGFAPMKWFFENAENEETTEPPPKKKRKVDDESTSRASGSPPGPDPLPELIPLQQVTVDLYFPKSLQELSIDPDRIAPDSTFSGASELDVHVYFPRTDRFGSCDLKTLQIYQRTKNGVRLVVAVPELPETTAEIMQNLIGNKSNLYFDWYSTKSQPVCGLRCVLKQSREALHTVVRLELSLSWVSGCAAVETRERNPTTFATLAYAFPEPETEKTHQQWSPQDFYDSVHVTDSGIGTKQLFNDVLESDLFPFQKRAVIWMLRREGLRVCNGRTERVPKAEQFRPTFFTEVQDANGTPCYVSHLSGTLCRNEPPMVEHNHALVSGGILAEEMGLGKTVELLALIKIHPRPAVSSGNKVIDPVSGSKLALSKACLIVCPPAILEQWKSEVLRHAPALKIMHYEGITGSKKGYNHEQVVSELLAQDIVLTTYTTLGRELHFAEEPPERSRRAERKYERKRSPLVEIEWWRVCIDEAQLIESGVTAAARVACRLPRVHSWAISGTPLRKNVEDLHGLLVFLRYKPLDENSKQWDFVVRNHKQTFRRIFQDLALRHTKAHVRDELRLPPQKRVVLTMPFTPIEQQHYSTMFQEMCADVNMNSDGSPNTEDWDPDNHTEAMRTWLARLRQTCLHPQVGGRNRRALGRGQGPLRTVAEVLDVMVNQNEASLRVEERTLLGSRLLHAHILGNNQEDEHRSEKALEIYLSAMADSATIVKDARERLRDARLKDGKADSAAVLSGVEEGESDTEGSSELGKLRTNLRSALQLQHACLFFAATANYQIKTNEKLTEPDSVRFQELEQAETSLYEEAKVVRREILRESSRKTEPLIRKIQHLIKENSFTQMPHIEDLAGFGGIENRRLLEKADEIFDIIRLQVPLIEEWRTKMATYLTSALVDEDEGLETTGEEYETSTKEQDELYVYFDAVKAIQADLNTIITGEAAPLIDHEVNFQLKQAKWFLDPEIATDYAIHAPELTVKLLTRRNELRKRVEAGSIRGLIQEARNLEGSMQMSGSNRTESERHIVQRHIAALQRVFREYSKALDGVEKEIDLFRQTQNQRLEFYRQLQETSDAVAPYKDELDEHLDLKALQGAIDKEQKQAKSLAQCRTKHRFLLHLRLESTSQSDARICVICQCTFETGVLTVCGHQYCKDCIKHWWRQSQSCPVCKRKLSMADFHNITYKPQELRAMQENQSRPSSPGEKDVKEQTPNNASIYSDVDTKLMDEVKSIDLPHSYGTKIDTLGRHLHWIREHDPGAKAIVFSQFREFLDVLGAALVSFKINFSRLGRHGAVEKFRNDPSIDCLLLDAKTDSSGLTLVNATHVFICEPLIQTAVELQAIARVHRIGQLRPTTVWMYLVSDTVEESIYEISVRRRLEHVQQQQLSKRLGKSRSATPMPNGMSENVLDAANSEQLQSAPLSQLLTSGKSGGEMVAEDDLWQCLFGKAGSMGETTVKPSEEMEGEVGRFLRAEAAEQRRHDGA